MEEDIKILEEFIKDYEATTDPLEQSAYFEEVPAKTIRNIINKYQEQEKVIELMTVDLMVCGTDFVSFGMFTGNFKKDKELVIEHYKKKAKGEQYEL